MPVCTAASGRGMKMPGAGLNAREPGWRGGTDLRAARHGSHAIGHFGGRRASINNDRNGPKWLKYHPFAPAPLIGLPLWAKNTSRKSDVAFDFIHRGRAAFTDKPDSRRTAAGHCARSHWRSLYYHSPRDWYCWDNSLPDRRPRALQWPAADHRVVRIRYDTTRSWQPVLTIGFRVCYPTRSSDPTGVNTNTARASTKKNQIPVDV